MHHRTQIGRADLLECLHAHDEAPLDDLAAALGYARRERKRVPEPPPRKPMLPEELAGSGKPGSPTTAVSPQARFYRVTAQRTLEPSEVVRDEPQWFTQAEPFRSENEICAPDGVRPPPQPPLMRWSRLWPFLKTALGTQQTLHTLDLPLVIKQLAHVKPLRHLPRQRRQTWAADSQIIIDYAAPLLPFWMDFNRLWERLQGLRGNWGLQIVAFPDGVPGDRCWVSVGGEWRDSDRYPLPGPSATVLVLSDLGCIDKTDGRGRQWQRLGLRLARTGCRPVALMPCPPRWWDSDLTRWFYPVCWDRTQRPPRRIGVRRVIPASIERAELEPGVTQLLALLAPAIRIEPALLRATRYLLSATVADVGSEAAVWNHPDVHATPLAFYYDREVITRYRNGFKAVQDADLRQKVAALIQAYHMHLSPAIGYEERLLLAELNKVGDPAAQQFSERIVKTLHTQEGTFAESLRAWFGRLAPRQHPAMWQNDALAAAWATVFLRQLQEDRAPPPGLDLNRISWLLGRGQTRRRYTLRQRGPALFVETDVSTSDDSTLDTPGSPLGEIDAAAPWMQLQRSRADSALSIESIQPLDQAIPLDPKGFLRLRTDHQELTIGPLRKPDWAEAIGRDKYGLHVELQIQKVPQRLRWVAPGEFLMGSPETEAERGNDETRHRVILTRGFWLADTACTQALWHAVMGDNPSRFKGAERPVEQVSWDDVQTFLRRLNEIVPGGGFRLPTEAEWEYACRARTETPFWFGEQITPEQVNYDGRYPYAGGAQGQSRQETVEVTVLPCNGWGLYQMHGNVWEWCEDRYGNYPVDTVIDPVGLVSGASRVLRGGSWIYDGRFARSAFRLYDVPGYRYHYFGFRLARTQADITVEIRDTIIATDWLEGSLINP
ncbi:MAG TPA: formylglycine-generating enzyme family protein [Candidatus Competibacteraceae bacterium]|nr:formylglycine-generating enzyme family protein [Candidatus Competibacteraceae bacterium]